MLYFTGPWGSPDLTLRTTVLEESKCLFTFTRFEKHLQIINRPRMGMTECVRWSRLSPFTGLFEVRAAEYLASCPEPEPSGVNKFLKGLGKPLASPLPKKGIICIICCLTVTVCCAFREQNEVLTEKVRDCLSSGRRKKNKRSVACQARRSTERRAVSHWRKRDRLGGDKLSLDWARFPLLKHCTGAPKIKKWKWSIIIIIVIKK